MNIVILGATSHIAKGLIDRFLRRGEDRLHLFSRSGEKVRRFLDTIGSADAADCTICSDYRSFPTVSCDVIINCIGVETRNAHNCDFTRYFALTEEFDGLVIGYLKNVNPDALYISFSSGAVYGRGFSRPADENSTNCLFVNKIAAQDYYGIARINAEAKHRAHSNLRIVDLRIFSYFSRYINLADGYFITDLLEAILNDKPLVTDDTHFVRDYLHPDDLFAMIVACAQAGRLNQAFDVGSLSPVSKQEILEYFAAEYRLKYEVRCRPSCDSATGPKNNYFSFCHHASRIGYRPRYTSMDSLQQEARPILKLHSKNMGG